MPGFLRLCLWELAAEPSHPRDKTKYGRLEELTERNRYTVYMLLEKAAKHPETPLEIKHGNFFAACMNQRLADRLGVKPIEPALRQVTKTSSA